MDCLMFTSMNITLLRRILSEAVLDYNCFAFSNNILLKERKIQSKCMLRVVDDDDESRCKIIQDYFIQDYFFI